MKVKEWLNKYVDFSSNETVRDNKGYCITLAVVGIIAGVVTGLFVVIVQLFTKNHDTVQTLANIVSMGVILTMLAYMVYLLLPLYKENSIGVGGKLLTTIISLVCLFVSFGIAVSLVAIAAILIAILLAAWIAFKIFGMSGIMNPPKSTPPSKEPTGPKQFRLDDGTILTDQGSGIYKGNDYHEYERNPDDTFTRKE